jgi:hypothetical protein
MLRWAAAEEGGVKGESQKGGAEVTSSPNFAAASPWTRHLAGPVARSFSGASPGPLSPLPLLFFLSASSRILFLICAFGGTGDSAECSVSMKASTSLSAPSFFPWTNSAKVGSYEEMRRSNEEEEEKGGGGGLTMLSLNWRESLGSLQGSTPAASPL